LCPATGAFVLTRSTAGAHGGRFTSKAGRDGAIWVQGLGDEGVMAFTDFGVESLVELIKIHREMTPREKR
jgi:hypothetical protein